MPRIVKLFFEPVLDDGKATADPKGFFGDMQNRRGLSKFRYIAYFINNQIFKQVLINIKYNLFTRFVKRAVKPLQPRTYFAALSR